MKLDNLPPFYQVDENIAQALQNEEPVVALESTVITHGLPYPQNKNLALDMEAEVRLGGAAPATIAVVDGVIRIGVEAQQLERLARGGEVHKISVRDFAPAILKGWSGGTTVAGTLLAAQAAGIWVFATGGIGGVHRSISAEEGREAARAWLSADISADLPQLARTPMIVVCAGAKAILDLPATLEYLETWGVPVVGYQTDEFPAFYSTSSSLKVSARADTPAEVARLARFHWDLGMKSAILVAQPPPAEFALPFETVGREIDRALREAQEQRIRGQQVTPFLLSRVAELSGGASLQANLALLRNNARLAAQIARAMAALPR